MSDWKTRHDIDQIKWASDELTRLFQANGVSSFKELLDKYYDQSVLDEKTSKLSDDLISLDSSLDGLNSSLIDFNQELINFDEDNNNLATDLSKLKDNLTSFLDAIGLFDVDLNALEESLSDLDEQMNGDGETDFGFVGVLQAIQESIYGGSSYSQQNPSSSSLMGMLNSFGSQLSNLSQGDTSLSLTLSTLSGYLTTFKGSLSQLQAKIISDLGQSTYDGLDSEIITLIGAITSANKDIDTHQDLIDDIEGTIGSPNHTASDGTLYGVLNNTSSIASETSTRTTNIQKTLYSGTNGTGTTSNPATNTVMKNLNTVKNTDIPSIENKIGNVDVANDGSLQSQISQTIYDIGVSQSDIENIQDLQYGANSGGTINNPTSTSVMGRIDDTETNIGVVQGDIDDVQGTLYKGSGGTGTTSTPATGTIMGNIGAVNEDVNGDLQTQIFKLITALSDLMGFANFVTDISEASISNNYVYNGVTYNRVSNDYPYDYIYVTSTNKYYWKRARGGKYVWIEWQDPLFDNFTSTKLHGILEQVYSLKTHTHSKSNITDFAHTHTASQITDSPYQLVQVIPTIMVLIKVYVNAYNVYITYENMPNEYMRLPTNMNYAFPVLIEEPYRPQSGYIYAPITHNDFEVYGAVNSQGQIYVLNHSNITQFGVYGALSYPLKSKLVSATGSYSEIELRDIEGRAEISASSNEKITLLAQLTDGTNPVIKPNIPIVFKEGSTTLGTVNTNGNGFATYEYTSQNKGEHSFTATNNTLTSNTLNVTEWWLTDHAVLSDYNSTAWYNYQNNITVSRDAQGTTLTGSSNTGYYIVAPNGNTSTTLNDYSLFRTFTMEFDFVNRSGTSSSTEIKLYLTNTTNSIAFNTLGINSAGHVKIVADGTNLTVWVNGTQTHTRSFSLSSDSRIGFIIGASTSHYLKFRNFKVY